MVAVRTLTTETSSPDITPIPLWQSVLFFGLPGMAVWGATYFLVPRMVASGIALGWAWTSALVLPLAMASGGVVAHHLTQPGNNWGTFARRFRFVPIQRQDWKWMTLALPLILVLNFSLEWTQPFLRDVLPLQPIIPELFVDPYATVSGDGTGGTFFGWPMAGQPWLLGFWLVWVIGVVFMEEVIWRGYLLPRMELTHGRWTWLVNGLLWNIPFHLYTMWNVFTDLPMMLIIPFIAQRTKSTWASVILHILLPYLAYAYLIPGVFGG
jgi:hypothetical protein